ncbi:MAG: hypothetical protein IGS39_12235 [Calothrix sp. C42_A2020_038]|nr:hypothetical protein [Calothrix sp. C42_A2020_038]
MYIFRLLKHPLSQKWGKETHWQQTINGYNGWLILNGATHTTSSVTSVAMGRLGSIR